MTNTRALAARVLQEVIQAQRSLTAVLPDALDQCEHPKDRTFLQEII